MKTSHETDFIDTMTAPSPTDAAARDRQVETACYGEPTTREGGGIGFVVLLWLSFAVGLFNGYFLAASRCVQ